MFIPGARGRATRYLERGRRFLHGKTSQRADLFPRTLTAAEQICVCVCVCVCVVYLFMIFVFLVMRTQAMRLSQQAVKQIVTVNWFPLKLSKT